MQATIERSVARPEQFDYEKRRFYDTVTWLAEVLPGSMRTPVEYQYDGHELYAGDGSSLGKIFDDSIELASGLPDYELRRRKIEKEEYKAMLKMMKSDDINTMVVVSDFPPELMDAKEDVGGYNVSRKQTMLRVLAKTSRGTINMYSQSLDKSDRQALENIYLELGFMPAPGELLGQRMEINISASDQELLVDRLMGIYDRSLEANYGGNWYAGQENGDGINTYDFACRQTDLLNAYLASTTKFTGGFRDYSLAAAVKERFLNRGITYDTGNVYLPVAAHAMAMAEMNGAGNRAQARGEVFSGCGASLQNVNNVSAEDQLAKMGYGNLADKESSGSEKLVWKDGICRIDNCPTKPGKTKVAQCSVCKLCQGWYDKGKDPSKVYSVVSKTSFWGIIENSFGKQDNRDEQEEL